MGGAPDSKKPFQLLFEHARFSVYLHESGPGSESPLSLQVSVKDTRNAPQQPADAEQAEAPVAEEVLFLDQPSYIVKRRSLDIFVEFPTERPAEGAYRTSSTGCWYGCEDSDEEVDDSESSTAKPQASSTAATAKSPPPCPKMPPPPPPPPPPQPPPSPQQQQQQGTGDAGSTGSGAAAHRAQDAVVVAAPTERPPHRAAVDRGWSVLRLAHWAWMGCDLEADLVHLSLSKVEWRILGIAAKMKACPKGSRIFSPEFEVRGVSGLGLVFYPNGNSNAKLGFCSLGLKAPHGAHLRYKLYIGNTERFTDLRHNVTESWGFVDMCKVEEELQQGEDMLKLGAEVIDDIDAHETLKSAGSSKVEWCIKNMQNKLAHYRKDVALYSDEFSAGGVDKLRLKFYPAGKREADPGWCSLYLEAPKGSELRCRLSVGRKSMSFDRLEKFGEDSIWGFLTLCKLRDELEQDGDTIRVGLEVLETKRLDGRLSESEDAYLKTLSAERRTWLLNELDRVEKLRSSGDGSVPSRFRILQLELPDQAKAVALSKLDAMHSDVLSGESSKLKKWIDGLLSIPFGSLKRPVVSIDEGRAKVNQYLEKARSALNEAVFGHEEPKKKIVQLLCQWIANPTSMSLVLGIQGPPGNGKTTLCRKGIAEALERPFVQISLGGATDASVLEGHSYTYVGSTWGRIAGLIMEAQCMNPVIFFDELDKVSDTPRGEEIVGVLTHLTDHSQNRTFTDRYFEGIPLDLSRALFVFSFNDESKLNHVLKDRLTVIHTEGFNQEAKLRISREYLLPELLTNVGLKKGDIEIGGEELNHLCQRCGVPTEEGGVRGIKQALESVILHVNEIRLTQDLDDEEKADGGEKTATADDREQPPPADRKKADDEHKAEPGEKKADVEHEVEGECKADGGEKAQQVQQSTRADDGERAQKATDPSEEKKKSARSQRAQGREKEPKRPKIKLPLKLTKELIEQLVTQKTKKDVCPMMYI